MKFKLTMLLMCVSAVAPAVFGSGSATAGMIRSNNDFQPEKLECPLRRGALKHVATKKEQGKPVLAPKSAQDVR